MSVLMYLTAVAAFLLGVFFLANSVSDIQFGAGVTILFLGFVLLGLGAVLGALDKIKRASH